MFEALASGNSDVTSPQIYQDMINSWKSDNGGTLKAFEKDLTIAVLKKSSAYLAFSGLIFLVLDLIIESGVNAFL